LNKIRILQNTSDLAIKLNLCDYLENDLISKKEFGFLWNYYLLKPEFEKGGEIK